MSEKTIPLISEKEVFARIAFDIIDRAERTGTPVIIWEEGRLQYFSPEEMRRRMALNGIQLTMPKPPLGPPFG